MYAKRVSVEKKIQQRIGIEIQVMTQAEPGQKKSAFLNRNIEKPLIFC